MTRNQRVRMLVRVLVGIALPSGVARGADDGFLEVFDRDPIGAQAWQMMGNEESSRFAYDAESRSLLARYDTSLPTARLVHALGRTLTPDDSFRFLVTFTIRSQGFKASSDLDAQIAFGLINALTTGPDRVGFTTAPKAFDCVALDYFPNVTFYGGPTLSPTIIQTDVGQGLFGAITFEQGAETELAQPGEPDLPQDVPLLADVHFRASTRRLTTRVSQAGVPLRINAGGGLDADPFTITTRFQSGWFAVNRFGLLLWEDTNSDLAGEPTVKADLVFHRIEVRAPAFGDLDEDGDVDPTDLTIFSRCLSGPAVPVRSGCELCDADHDQDVDQDDFGVFQLNWTGAR